MSTTPTTASAYTGWFRPRKGVAWTQIVVGADYDATLSLLVDALANLHGGDSVVLRAGENPNAPRPHRGGGRRL